MAERNNQTVSLGCGTLILIALIVMMFSNNRGELEVENRELRSDIAELSQALQSLRETLDSSPEDRMAPSDK